MPGAICQPGIIRFPRSFNEINNGDDGEDGRKNNFHGKTRKDTAEDSLLSPRAS